MTESQKGLGFVVLLSLFWGSNIVASRFGIGEFDPLFFILLRLSIAATVLVPVLLIQQRKIPTDPELIWKGMFSGLVGAAIPISAFIYSLQYQSSGVASLYVATFPAMIAVAAHFFLPDEKMSMLKGLGVALALGGTLVLAISGESGLAGIGRASPLGAILVVGGLMFEVVNTIFVRLRMQGMDTLQVTTIRLFTAAVVMAVVAWIGGDFSITQVTRAGLFSLLWAALIGALGGQFLAFFIQRRFGATTFSMTSFLVPVVATLGGAALLGEIITPTIGFGFLLIGGGLYFINRPRRNRA